MKVNHPDDFMGDALDELADEVRRELADVGMRPEERWAMVLYKKLQVGEGAMFWGRLILPKHITGEDGYHVTPAFRFPTTWEPKHRGFRFDALGRIRDPVKHAAGTEAPCPTIVLPPMRDRETGLLSPPFVLEAWRRRAFHDPSPVFAQVDWRPGWTEEVYSFGGVVPTGKNDISRAQQGLKIMQWEPSKGRPKGSGTYSNGGELRAVTDPVVRNLKAKRVRPTQQRVADHLPGRPDTRTLRDWVGDLLGMTWDEYIDSVPA